MYIVPKNVVPSILKALYYMSAHIKHNTSADMFVLPDMS